MLLLFACTDPAESPKDTVEDESEWTFSDVTITPAEQIPTVLDVTFTTDAPDAGWVSFGPADETGWTATATSTGEGTWEARLVGLPAGMDAWVTVGAGDVEGPTTELAIEEAPDWIDLLEASEGDPTPGFLAVGVAAGQGSGAAIVDTRGRPVWWYPTPEGVVGTVHTRARVSFDLDEVWFNVFTLPPVGGIGDGQGVLVRVAIDGSSEEVISVPFNHHDFLLHEDGTVAWIDVDQRDVNGAEIRGDIIMEQAPDGTQTQIWSAWDLWEYLGDGSETWWTMCNHLEYDPGTQTYTISSRNYSKILHIDRATGEVLWSVGDGGTYPPDDPFSGQHGFDVLDDGILVFDNGHFDDLDSRLARYSFSEGAATLDWEYRADPPVYSFVMGDAHMISDDRARVVFSTQADVREVDSSGEVLSSFNWEVGTIIGFAEEWDSLVR